MQMNLAITKNLQSIQPRWFIDLNILVTLFEYSMVILIAPLCCYLWITKRRREAFFIALAGLSWFVTRILKTTFGIPCPTPQEVHYLYPFHLLSSLLHRATNGIAVLDASVCYPSGHVYDYISLWGIIYILRDKIWKTRWWRNFVAALCIILISLIGIARISLGDHWFTDVVGGYLFGFAWLMSLAYFYSHRQKV